MAIETLPLLLIALTVFMAFISGANDGGAILALPARVAEKGILAHLGILSIAIFLGPMFTTTVSQTLVGGLFDFGGDDGALIFMIGTAVGLILVAVLNRMGLPTSLTLALVGGLTGVGLGAGALVDSQNVIRVLLIGLLAPVLGFTLAAVGFYFVRRFGGLTSSTTVGGPLNRLAFGALALAYAINDGQKMVAIGAVAVLTLAPGVNVFATEHLLARGAMLAVLVVFFVLGTFSRIRKVGYRLGLGLARIGGVEALLSQASASSAVLLSSALGAPVSMTQAISGGIVGASIPQGAHRVRWIAVSKMLAAWVVTLPASLVGGYLLGLMV